MTVESPKVSVVIPTLNAGPGFGELLEKLRAQRVDFDYEVLVIDSGSTDGTAELARRYGATVYEIPRCEFNHGATRNLGISLARGEYVALTVQDAVPLDERWLTTMVENLEQDERVAGVYGRQIPRPESSVLTRTGVNNRATAGLERREQFADDPKGYGAMPPYKRRRLAVFDNVSSCLRRSVWEEFPFEKADFGEDLRWGRRVIEAGYKIVYEPRSAVMHSHERGPVYELRRHYVNQLILLELFGVRMVPSLGRLSEGIRQSSLHYYRLLRQEKAPGGVLRSMLLAIKYAVPAQVGAYLGGRGGYFGAKIDLPAEPQGLRTLIYRLSPRVFGPLNRFLSKGI